MTIKYCRFYIMFDDPELSKRMNFLHWGVANWLEYKLKSIKEKLNGSEVKGVNIVNVKFYESTQNIRRKDEWIHVINTFEYSTIYDFQSFVLSPPIENIQKLIKVASKILLHSPWPQVQSIGQLLGHPLCEKDLQEIQRFCDEHNLLWNPTR